MEVFPPPFLAKLQLDPADRAARPSNLTETPISDDVEHDEYLRVLNLCTDTQPTLPHLQMFLPKLKA